MSARRINRPFSKLRRLPRAHERAAPQPEGSFEALVGSVAPLEPAPLRVPPPAPVPAALPAPRPARRFAIDQDDGWIQGLREGEQQALLRRLAAIQEPAATLDLHGLSAEHARQAVRRFVPACARRGERVVLVIVGKGRRSPGGVGVLREEIAAWLSEPPCGAHVRAFVTAHRVHGGTGALYVALEWRKV